jgi:6-pyruvoyltetrahydropterin/6-carboxytetrahydropterin synthase
MRIEITRRFSFEAAHSLPKHDGKCRNLHGHSYVLEVTISGPIIKSGPKEGMVRDFADITSVVEEKVLQQWDHQFLNDKVHFPTTVENLAAEIFRRIKAAKLPVTKIKLFETARGWAEVTK